MGCFVSKFMRQPAPVDVELTTVHNCECCVRTVLAQTLDPLIRERDLYKSKYEALLNEMDELKEEYLLSVAKQQRRGVDNKPILTDTMLDAWTDFALEHHPVEISWMMPLPGAKEHCERRLRKACKEVLQELFNKLLEVVEIKPLTFEEDVVGLE